jgi:hypothetical protein
LHCSLFVPEKRRIPTERRAQVVAVAQYSNALKACQPSLLRQVYGTSKSLIHGLFPATCLLCLDPGQPPDLDLCRDCEADLPRNDPACPRCAMPLACAQAGCGHCSARPAGFDAAFAPLRYEFPLVELIHRLKYGGQIAIARILGIACSSGARRRSKRWCPCRCMPREKRVAATTRPSRSPALPAGP